jgi:hypothetical protein
MQDSGFLILDSSYRILRGEGTVLRQNGCLEINELADWFGLVNKPKKFWLVNAANLSLPSQKRNGMARSSKG